MRRKSVKPNMYKFRVRAFKQSAQINDSDDRQLTLRIDCAAMERKVWREKTKVTATEISKSILETLSICRQKKKEEKKSSEEKVHTEIMFKWRWTTNGDIQRTNKWDILIASGLQLNTERANKTSKNGQQRINFSRSVDVLCREQNLQNQITDYSTIKLYLNWIIVPRNTFSVKVLRLVCLLKIIDGLISTSYLSSDSTIVRNLRNWSAAYFPPGQSPSFLAMQ